MKSFLSVFLLLSPNIFSQTFTLSGKISDFKTGEILPYANIRVLKTTLGTAANINGEFEIKLSKGNYLIAASYIGYYSDTIDVNLDTNFSGIDFQLKKTEIVLPEIVVLSGENPALEIIRKAIEKKNERNEKLDSYEFEAYTKGLIRTTDEISAKGRTVSGSS